MRATTQEMTQSPGTLDAPPAEGSMLKSEAIDRERQKAEDLAESIRVQAQEAIQQLVSATQKVRDQANGLSSSDSSTTGNRELTGALPASIGEAADQGGGRCR